MSLEVQNTSIDAAVSKLSAINLSYFSDEFLHHLVPEDARKRRSPVINRGYYARSSAFEMVFSKFFESWQGVPHQVISLGGGSETTWFRLKSRGRAPHLYVELDMPDVVSRKIKVVTENPAFSSLTSNGRITTRGLSSHAAAGFDSDGYKICSMDLTMDVAIVEQTLVRECGVDLNLPTLFISECVLVYIDPEYSGRLIQWAGARFPAAVFCTYEQILPYDMFGRTMMDNLKRRGCELKGISAHPTLDAQRDRFLSRGWTSVFAWDMKKVYYNLLDSVDRARIEKLEIFDEFEEFHLMMSHYSFVVASNGDFVGYHNSNTD